MKYLWWNDNDSLAVVSYDPYTREISPIGTSMSIFISGSKVATHIPDIGALNFDWAKEPDIPTEYHMGIVYGVLKLLHERDVSTVNLAQYNDNQYEKMVRRAKKDTRQHKQEFGTVIPTTY